MSESDKREKFNIPRDPQAPEQASEAQQASGQRVEDGSRGEEGDGRVNGRRQAQAQEESRQGVGGGVGEVVEIKGVVVDVRFDEDELPEIFNALKVEFDVEGGETDEVTLEVQQIVGDDVVRTVAMGSTDGMSRGLEARDTGQPIAIPVGKGVLGRLMDVLGTPIDEQGEIEDADDQ